MSKWDGAFYRYQMPTVEINILWDGAACCFQIARIFIYFQHCIHGIFNLRLPPMYAIVIIPLHRVLYVTLLLYSMFLLGSCMSMGQA